MLLGLLPRHLRQLPWRLRFRFGYALCYYVLMSASTLAGLVLALLAAVTGQGWVQVSYPQFLARWPLVFAWLLLITLLLKRRGLLRPPSAPVLSWENWLYNLARWPYIGWGVAAACWQRLVPPAGDFPGHPEGAGQAQPLPVRLIVPYLLISTGCAAPPRHRCRWPCSRSAR